MTKRIKWLTLSGIMIIAFIFLAGCGDATTSSEESVTEEPSVTPTDEKKQEAAEESMEEPVEEKREEEEKASSLGEEEFLSNFVKGLEERWAISAKYGEGVLSRMSAEELQRLYRRLIEAESKSIGDLENYSFTDEELKRIAEDYWKGVQLQLDGFQYVGTDDYEKQATTWQLGYYYRTAAIGDIYNNYSLNITEAFKKDWEECVAEAPAAKQALSDGTAAEVNSESVAGAALEVVGYTVSHSEENTELGVKVRNNTDKVLCTPTINVGTLNEENDILDSIELQAMVALLPGQTIRLTYYGDLKGANSFFVDQSAWVEYEGDIYDAEVDGHLDPISLVDGKEDFVELTKSETNCIDGSVTNFSSGQDIGLSVESVRLDSDGMCYAEIKNNTDEAVNTVTAHASLMDENGNILDWLMLQEPVSVNPGQSVTLSNNCDVEGASYMTVSYLAAYTADDDYISGYVSTIPQADSK